MKKVALYASAIAFALLLTFGGSLGLGTGTTSVAFAQETAVPTVGTSTQSEPVRPVDRTENNNNDFPWGLLGLLGLAGLAGMQRRQEPVRQETTKVSPTVGVYDSKK